MGTTALREFIETITWETARILLLNYSRINLGVKFKTNPADVVTEADLKANSHIVRRITKAFPDHGIISEESGRVRATAEYTWIIDPLDGSRSFATKTPLWGFMISVMKGKQMHMAAICNPLSEEIIIAEQGKGARKNGKKVTCSKQASFAFSYGCMSQRFSPRKNKFFKEFLDRAKGREFWVNAFGSIAVNAVYVADGRRDWLVSVDTALHDYAAPSLVLQEAGCQVTTFQGQPWQPGDTTFVAANPLLHKELMKIVAGIQFT